MRAEREHLLVVNHGLVHHRRDRGCLHTQYIRYIKGQTSRKSPPQQPSSRALPSLDVPQPGPNTIANGPSQPKTREAAPAAEVLASISGAPLVSSSAPAVPTNEPGELGAARRHWVFTVDSFVVGGFCAGSAVLPWAACAPGGCLFLRSCILSGARIQCPNHPTASAQTAKVDFLPVWALYEHPLGTVSTHQSRKGSQVKKFD